MKWPFTETNPTQQPARTPGNGRSALRIMGSNHQLRVQASNPDYALELYHPDDDRIVRIDWDGNIHTDTTTPSDAL